MSSWKKLTTTGLISGVDALDLGRGIKKELKVQSIKVQSIKVQSIKVQSINVRNYKATCSVTWQRNDEEAIPSEVCFVKWY